LFVVFIINISRFFSTIATNALDHDSNRRRQPSCRQTDRIRPKKQNKTKALHAGGVDVSDVDVFERMHAIETLPRSPIEARAVTNSGKSLSLCCTGFAILTLRSFHFSACMPIPCQSVSFANELDL
jgi:hypothetical protein